MAVYNHVLVIIIMCGGTWGGGTWGGGTWGGGGHGWGWAWMGVGMDGPRERVDISEALAQGVCLCAVWIVHARIVTTKVKGTNDKHLSSLHPRSLTGTVLPSPGSGQWEMPPNTKSWVRRPCAPASDSESGHPRTATQLHCV